ncbi:MAG: GatB/YqeY domain-containing protein [Candidatus Omnitrophica bacterium]|jgi:hypothetical protein|nr:GatB/YqeY domain-containing protein [Candidatus Omnitrophota bacterium]
MSIYEQIKFDIITSMKTKNGETTVLRTLDSDIQLQKLNKRLEITDDLVISIVNKSIKQHEESIEMFIKGNRQDLVTKEQNEIDILKRYQPKQMSEQEVTDIINESIKTLNATSKKEMGLVIKQVMSQTKGLFDSKRISQLINERLK